MGDALHDQTFFAFYGLLQVQARTTELISRELEARTGLAASWYELMACLQGCGDEGCRMNELADELLISRGGATKLVARLEEAGYLRRFTPAHDRRATYAQLTDAGRAAVEAAHPVQLELTKQHFGRFLTDEETMTLVRISSKVLAGVGAECTWLNVALEELGDAAAGASTDGVGTAAAAGKV
ncbi:MAG: MarR family transcriptional regulator [Patulibacter minatonensis]